MLDSPLLAWPLVFVALVAFMYVLAGERLPPCSSLAQTSATVLDWRRPRHPSLPCAIRGTHNVELRWLG
jgi:hypothetical protein